MHGYHTIHALAYETFEGADSGASDYEKMFEQEDDDLPLLVFHFGMTLKTIKDILAPRKIILKK
jgi:hypothetical protein